MPYLAIEDFKGGLDKRRMEITAPVGSLQTLKNAHITRGGEIEKSLAFISAYVLPAGTFGFAIVKEKLYVFGSAAAPGGLSVDITYQRLQNPASSAMTAIIAVDVSAGKLYVIAEYADGSRHHFYDGAIIGDWFEGVVTAAMTNNDGIADALKVLIDASPDYSATRAGSVVTITGASSSPFTISSSARNGAGNTFNDQSAAVATTQTAVAGVVEVLSKGSFRVTGGSASSAANRVRVVTVDGVDVLGGPAEVLATGHFTITGGTNSAGVNYVAQVLVNGVDILGAHVDWVTSNTATAAAVVAQINGFTSTPEYTASNLGAVITITALAGTGSSVNGFVVTPSAAGDPTFGTIGNMSGGVYDGVAWATSNSATATAVANRINAYTSSTEYTASASGDKVTLTALATTGATPNGRVVAGTIAGDVLISEITNFAGGVNAGSGQPQISTVTIAGTFEAGDLFSVTLGDGTGVAPGDATYGAGRTAGLKAEKALKVHKNKVYTANLSTLLFSGVGEPTKWKAEQIGSGAVDMSSQASGFENITALGIYQNNLAIFSRNVTQVWFVDPDPDSNQQLQVLENMGTRSPRAVIGFGDSDVFFPSDTGIRSLKPRDASNAAAVSDVGTPIDPLVVAAMGGLTEDQIAAACAVIEPKDGRYILSLGVIMYVFSYFASSKVSSWSTYEKGLTVDWFAKSGTKIYARVGDIIYLLGGADGATYETLPAVVELPYISAKKLANWKEWNGIDMAVEGAWLVEYNTDPNQPTVFETIGTIDKHTMGELNTAIQAFGPVFKLRFTNTAAGAAKIGTILLHYKETHQT